MKYINRKRLLNAVALICWLGPEIRCSAADEAMRFNIASDGRPITLPVNFKEKTYTFLLDTGSPFTTLDRNTFREAIRPYPHTLPTDTPRTRYPEEIYNPQGLHLSHSMPLRMQPMYSLSLENAAIAVGTPIHGILGCDFLRHYEVVLDSDKQQIMLQQPTATKRGKEFALIPSDNGCFSVILNVHGKTGTSPGIPFLIDTGHSSISTVAVHADLFDALLSTNRLTFHSAGQTATLSGNYATRRGIARNLALMQHHSNISISSQNGPGLQNLLGIGYLTQFNMVIDFPNATLYVSPRKTPGMPLDLQDCSGFGFVREQGMILIKRVEPASPAFKADLRLDDAILAVNGVAGEKIDLYQLRLELCQPGKDVKLKIRRNLREHSVTLHLEDWNKPVTADDFE